MTEQPGQFSPEKFNATGPLIVHRFAFREESWVKSSENAVADGSEGAPRAGEGTAVEMNNAVPAMRRTARTLPTHFDRGR